VAAVTNLIHRCHRRRLMLWRVADGACLLILILQLLLGDMTFAPLLLQSSSDPSLLDRLQRFFSLFECEVSDGRTFFLFAKGKKNLQQTWTPFCN
jgi:hypothetical protein